MRCCATVLHGKVMRKIGVEVVGLGALKLTGFLKELMQQRNINFESIYTVRTLKEVLILSLYLRIFFLKYLYMILRPASFLAGLLSSLINVPKI